MILEALTCLAGEINDYFKTKYETNEEKVILSPLINQDGTMIPGTENKIIITLINVERENTVKSPRQKGIGFQNSPEASPSMDLNVHVIFSANFDSDKYSLALSSISDLFGYFQNKNVFTKDNAVKLDNKIEKLIFETTEFNPYALGKIWLALGAKYMPSAIYKIRILSADETDRQGVL